MTFNPEFQRNLWKEFSMQRIIAMPLILLLIFYINYSNHGNSFSGIPETSIILIMLLLVVWGSGLAGDAVFEEIQDHTWELQKMTPLGPWVMSWGKLFGKTSFVWYGTFLCSIVYFLSETLNDSIKISLSESLFKYFYCVLTGLAAQGFALFSALLIQRISPERSRTKVALIQVFTVIVFLSLYLMGRDLFPSVYKMHSWYSLQIPIYIMSLSIQIFVIFWLAVAIYRLFRVELQVKTAPWIWPIFVVVWALFCLGFVYQSFLNNSNYNIQIIGNALEAIPNVLILSLNWNFVYLIILGLTFLSAFFTPKNIVHSMRWVEYIKKSEYKKAFQVTPTWMLSLFLAFITLIGYLCVINLSSAPSADTQTNLELTGFSTSLFLFLIRDIGILYFLCWNIKAKRAHLATVVYLILLYVFLPICLSLSGLMKGWLAILLPLEWLAASNLTLPKVFAINFIILLEAGLAWYGVYTRFRTNQMKMSHSV